MDEMPARKGSGSDTRRPATRASPKSRPEQTPPAALNAAQDLLAMYKPAEQSRETVQHSASSANGETRRYYFSPGTVQHERELLSRYHAEDFRGLLAETQMLLVGLVKIMKITP